MQTAKVVNYTPPDSLVIEEYDPAQWERYVAQCQAACVVPTHTGERPNVLILKPELVAAWKLDVADAKLAMRHASQVSQRYKERLTASDIAQITKDLNHL